MGDPFEGHYTRITSLSEDAFVATQMTDEVFRTIPESTWRENFRRLLADVPDQKLSMFVNCWHMNEKESMYMWKIYASHHESICVQSTYRKLALLLPDDAFVGIVKYIDYDTDYIDVTFAVNYIVHKRTKFFSRAGTKSRDMASLRKGLT